jgi:cell wall integrity and stress response component
VTSFIPSAPTTTMSTLPTNQSDTSAVPIDPPSFWESTGKVAGVFVVVGIVIAALIIAIIWMCRSKRGKRDVEKSEDVPPMANRRTSGTQPVSRSTSLLQLLGRRDRDKSRSDEAVTPTSNGTQRLSRTGTDLALPVPAVDQRLDPQSMMIRFDDNDSRTSFRDEEDYSRRVWRVTNASDSDSLSTGQ